MMIISLFMLLLLCISCQPAMLEGDRFTYPEKITALSISGKVIWAGTETGAILQLDKETMLFSEPVGTKFGMVYAIEELSDGLLLKGSHNGGLTMLRITDGMCTAVTTYRIEGKEDKYSAYSFIVRQDSLICGTSNGLYKAPLVHDGGDLYMTPILPRTGADPEYRFYSVAEDSDGFIYSAGKKGLVRIGDAVEILSERAFCHLSVSDGGVIALSDDGKLFRVSDMSRPTFTFAGHAPSACYENGDMIWGFRNDAVDAVHSDGTRRSYSLPDIRGGGRNLTVFDDNFLYTASGHVLTRICLHEPTHRIYLQGRCRPYLRHRR